MQEMRLEDFTEVSLIPRHQLADLLELRGYSQGSIILKQADGSARKVHRFVTEDGEPLEVWGFKELDDKMEAVPMRRFVLVQYNGAETDERGKVKKHMANVWIHNTLSK